MGAVGGGAGQPTASSEVFARGHPGRSRLLGRPRDRPRGLRRHQEWRLLGDDFGQGLVKGRRGTARSCQGQSLRPRSHRLRGKAGGSRPAWLLRRPRRLRMEHHLLLPEQVDPSSARRVRRARKLKAEVARPGLRATTELSPSERAALAKVDVIAVRVEGDRGYVLYKASGTEYAMPTADEAGSWKLAAASGTPLSS